MHEVGGGIGTLAAIGYRGVAAPDVAVRHLDLEVKVGEVSQERLQKGQEFCRVHAGNAWRGWGGRTFGHRGHGLSLVLVDRSPDRMQSCLMEVVAGTGGRP